MKDFDNDKDQRIRAALKNRTHDFRAFRSSVYEAAKNPDPMGGESSDRWNVYSLSDFSNLDAVPKIYPQHEDRWGNWEFDALRLVLKYAPSDRHWSFWVDLNRCKTSAAMLDWVFQITKSLSAADLGDMLEALNDLLDPQTNLCSGGKNKQIPSVADLIDAKMNESVESIDRKLASESESTSQSSRSSTTESTSQSSQSSTVEVPNSFHRSQEQSNDQSKQSKQSIN